MEPQQPHIPAESSTAAVHMVREETTPSRRMDSALQQTLAAFLEERQEPKEQVKTDKQGIEPPKKVMRRRRNLTEQKKRQNPQKKCSRRGCRWNNCMIYRVIGQLFATYILLEQHGKLIIIDQHAAHERLIYERLVQLRGNMQLHHSNCSCRKL